MGSVRLPIVSLFFHILGCHRLFYLSFFNRNGKIWMWAQGQRKVMCSSLVFQISNKEGFYFPFVIGICVCSSPEKIGDFWFKTRFRYSSVSMSLHQLKSFRTPPELPEVYSPLPGGGCIAAEEQVVFEPGEAGEEVSRDSMSKDTEATQSQNKAHLQGIRLERQVGTRQW